MHKPLHILSFTICSNFLYLFCNTLSRVILFTYNQPVINKAWLREENPYLLRTYSVPPPLLLRCCPDPLRSGVTAEQIRKE
jgi:hypothetical protein